MLTSDLLPSTTPVPNRLLDTLMPSLSDTELRVLLVVVRQTLGWKSERGNSRKTSDWMTHRQLLAKTGRESAAISRAIQSLVQKQLIQVEDEAGRILLNATERRASHGRIYYRLYPRRLGTTSESEVCFSLSEAEPTESEDTIAKTTKETEYKKRASRQGVIHNLPVDNSSSLTSVALRKLAKEEDFRLAARRFLTVFQDRLWQERRAAIPPKIVWTRDEPLVMELLSHYSYEHLECLLNRFASSEYAWLRQRGYSLQVFHALLIPPPGAGTQASGFLSACPYREGSEAKSASAPTSLTNSHS